MPRTIRFHLDENCHRAVAEGLRRRGIDATASAEVGLLNASDEDQLGHAVRECRVLFSHDRDLLRLDAAGVPHHGIAFCGKDAKKVGALIEGLVLIWEVLEPEEMRNEESKLELDGNERVRELSRISIKRLINQLIEEIARYEAHASPTHH